MKSLFCRIMLAVMVMTVYGCLITDRYQDEGKQYIVSEDWDKSARYYREYLEKHPDDTEARLLLERSRWKAAEKHLIRGETLLRNGSWNEAIVEFQLSYAMNPSNRKVAVLIKKARDMRAADFSVRQGKNFVKTGHFVQARESFQKALALAPESTEARRLLAYYEKKEARPPKFRLRLKNNAPISLKFKKTPVLNVFEILSQLTGVNFIFDKDIKDTKVTLFMTDVSFDRFLDVLLGTHNLAAKIVDEKTMIIYPATASKIKEYQELQIRTFYLANMEAKQAVGLLSKMLKSKYIIANEALNAVILRAPGDVVELASRIIDANDRAPAEVMLSVEILEVSRTREKQLGLDLNPTSVTIGLGEARSDVEEGVAFADKASLKALNTLSSKELMLSVPTVTLNFLKQDGDTRTLARPQIRVKSGNSSKVLIGERVPLRTNRRVDTTGVVTFDFQYYEIGVKLDARPVVNVHGEVTLEIKLEISALGPNIGTGEDPQYSIRTRTAQSLLTVYDGESVIIGGLISDEERETLRKIPFLGDIPMIGRIFANQDTNDTRTDIIMAITPIVTRNQEIPEIGVTQVWSGAEDHFSVSEPYENIAKQAARYTDRPRQKILLEEQTQETGGQVVVPPLRVE
ncbi:general secretion pathway protein GspD [Desulfonema ishimotonii]|uniref:General secretion pathway protein GspD n=2 Tax=Desulfonema ishimotonii TaxID=45657 RepID=A0A401FS81_9BACT|nr:general secretion pathway protein GspD [Desulfonema ishimotonii]